MIVALKRSLMASMTEDHVNNDRKVALKGLLDDPAPVVQTALKAEFQRLGPVGRRLLEEIVEDADGELKNQAQTCLEDIFGPDPASVVLDFIWGLSYELETGLIMLHRVIDPDIEAHAIQRDLDNLAERCRELLVEPGNPMEVCRVINRVLFHEAGFRGVPAGWEDPSACSIGLVLREKRGLSILLSAIYISIAQRLKMDLEPIALPGRFMVGCFKLDWPVYIDPLRGGKMRTLEEMHEFLLDHDTEPEVHHLAPSPIGEVLYRVCLELADNLNTGDQPVLAAKFEKFARAFEKSHSL